MTRSWMWTGVLLVLLGTPSSARQAAQAPPNQPGMPTTARVVVINQSRDEAVPVIVHGGGDVLPVAVISAPALTLAEGAAAGTRALRQPWDYRHLVFKSGEDVGAGLGQAGTDGWEAVGVSPTGIGGVQVLLKRPR